MWNVPSLLCTQTRSPSSIRSTLASQHGMLILRNSPCTSEMPQEHPSSTSPRALSGMNSTSSPLIFRTGPSKNITSSMAAPPFFANNCWTGTSGQGHQALYPLSYWLDLTQAFRPELSSVPGGTRTHNLPRVRRSNPVLHHVQPLSLAPIFPSRANSVAQGEGLVALRLFSAVAQTSVCALHHGTNRPPISDSCRQTLRTSIGRGPFTQNLEGPRPVSSIQAGRNNRSESRSLSPASCYRRSNSSPRHPGSLSGGNDRSAWFELLSLTRQAGF